MDNSNHHAVVGTLAHLFHKQDSDECDVYSSAPRLGSNIDYDSDSDFEEDDVEDQDLHASGPNNGVQVLGPGSSSRSNEDEQPDMGVHLPTLDSVKTQTPRAGTDTSKSIANADLSEPCSYSSRSIVTLGLSDSMLFLYQDSGLALMMDPVQMALSIPKLRACRAFLSLWKRSGVTRYTAQS